MLEPVGMIESLLIFIVILLSAFTNGTGDFLLDTYPIVCWIVLIGSIIFAVIQAAKTIDNDRKRSVSPVTVIICSFVTHLCFSFLLMCVVRDIALVASEGVIGLFGVILLAPLTYLALEVCKFPNLLSLSVGVEEEPILIVLDAVLTPALSAGMCALFGYFGFFDSVMNALFGV